MKHIKIVINRRNEMKCDNFDPLWQFWIEYVMGKCFLSQLHHSLPFRCQNLTILLPCYAKLTSHLWLYTRASMHPHLCYIALFCDGMGQPLYISSHVELGSRSCCSPNCDLIFSALLYIAKILQKTADLSQFHLIQFC